MFNFGKSFGIITGIIAGFKIPMYFVKPSVWKILMGLDSMKINSLIKADLLFKNHNFKNKDGEAEAALLAYFGKRFWRSNYPGNGAVK